MNKTEIKNALLESVFDPKVPGPFSLVSKTVRPDYFLMRTLELVGDMLDNYSEEKMTTAIAFLAIAKLQKRETNVI